MSALSQIAKDPSCLLAVDALQGGRWLSCFKPDGVQPAAPSGSGTWEARTGLLTFTNVDASGGVFRAADSSARWNVKTPLRWQNLTAATILTRATVGDFPETVFSFGLPANPNYSAILLRRSAENQLYASLLGTRADGSSVYRTMTADFSFVSGKKDTFAFVFDIDGDFMRLYANGELLASAAVRPLVAIAVDGATRPGFMLGTTSFSDAVNSGSAVSSALVFDRALTQPEIAAISNIMG